MRKNEGLLVEVSSATITNVGGEQFTMNDGSGSVHVYIDYTTGIRLSHYPGFGVGAVVRVIGVAGQYYSTHELKPRFVSDIEVLEPAPLVPQSSRNARVIMKNVSYAASNNIGKAERLSSDSENLLQQVLENDLDTSECEVTLSGAEKYLSLAEEALSGNSVAANNYALKAMALFEKAIKCLTGLLR